MHQQSTAPHGICKTTLLSSQVPFNAAGAIDTPRFAQPRSQECGRAPFTTLFLSRAALPKHFFSHSIVVFLYQKVSPIGFWAWLFRNALGIAIAQRAHAMI
jgi:hypothetical protein